VYRDQLPFPLLRDPWRDPFPFPISPAGHLDCTGTSRTVLASPTHNPALRFGPTASAPRRGRIPLEAAGPLSPYLSGLMTAPAESLAAYLPGALAWSLLIGYLPPVNAAPTMHLLS
jgi:hypothetical protein